MRIDSEPALPSRSAGTLGDSPSYQASRAQLSSDHAVSLDVPRLAELLQRRHAFPRWPGRSPALRPRDEPPGSRARWPPPRRSPSSLREGTGFSACSRADLAWLLALLRGRRCPVPAARWRCPRGPPAPGTGAAPHGGSRTAGASLAHCSSASRPLPSRAFARSAAGASAPSSTAWVRSTAGFRDSARAGTRARAEPGRPAAGRLRRGRTGARTPARPQVRPLRVQRVQVPFPAPPGPRSTSGPACSASSVKYRRSGPPAPGPPSAVSASRSRA